MSDEKIIDEIAEEKIKREYELSGMITTHELIKVIENLQEVLRGEK